MASWTAPCVAAALTDGAPTSVVGMLFRFSERKESAAELSARVNLKAL